VTDLRTRRVAARKRRAVLRTRAAANRLAASCLRRPRSLATHAIAAGVDRATAAGVASALRTVAKRLGIEPALTARTRRTVKGGRASQTHQVYRYTRAQVAAIVAAYRPRKAEYKAAALALAA
jgi:hypothetical protein